jgi:hypothetical protein
MDEAIMIAELARGTFGKDGLRSADFVTGRKKRDQPDATCTLGERSDNEQRFSSR